MDDTERGALVARFLKAQDSVYPEALMQLRAGRKTSHWMWFIFPQLDGLGRSETAHFYALHSLDEARAFAGHSVLGARLRECVGAVLLHALDGPAPRSLSSIFGAPDDLKFISSMTLFTRALPEEALFRTALDAFNGGTEDSATVDLLSRR